jgi:ribonuclease HI
MDYEVYIYTDGSCLGNPGKGGYGIIMHAPKYNFTKEFLQGYRLTTNNRMELLAVIIALEKLKNPTKVLITTDSKYVIDSVVKKWVFNWHKKGYKDKKNADLWKRFLKIYPKHEVAFQWVKGHNDHPQNERCDALAVAAANSKKLLIDEGYETSIEKNKGFFD